MKKASPLIRGEFLMYAFPQKTHATRRRMDHRLHLPKATTVAVEMD